jgi:hypothetical protein
MQFIFSVLLMTIGSSNPKTQAGDKFSRFQTDRMIEPN